MPYRLHERVLPVVARNLDTEEDRDIGAWLLAYYEPRLRDAARALVLDRLKSSATLRIQAGYAPDARAAIDPVVAENWFRRESETVITLIKWLMPETLKALPLILDGELISRALAITDDKELAAWIEARRTDIGFQSRAARAAIAEFDALANESSP